MKENIIQIKSYDFALKIIKLYTSLIHDKKEYVLSKQLLRSGTSVGKIEKKQLEVNLKEIFSQN